MKQLSALLIIVLLPSFLAGETAKIKSGQSIQQATTILGEPIGVLELGVKTLLIYPQGDITFRDGVVSEINLMTDAQFAAEQVRKKIERQEWLIEQERLAAKRFEEGTRLKADKLQSGVSATLPARQRVGYWRAFQVRYPEVDVSEALLGALEDRQDELAEEQMQKRIAELEVRVARAEQAAADAQTENERLRNEISIQGNLYQARPINYIQPYGICYPQRRVIVRTRGNNHARNLKNCSAKSRRLSSLNTNNFHYKPRIVSTLQNR